MLGCGAFAMNSVLNLDLRLNLVIHILIAIDFLLVLLVAVQ